MKVYIAGMFSTIKERRRDAGLLRSAGIEVTSRWLDEIVPHTVTMKDLPDMYHRETSMADIEDIKKADAFIMCVPTETELADTPARSLARGGRQWEMGYAYALNKPIFVIGGHENIFHYLDGVSHFQSIEELINAVSRPEKFGDNADGLQRALRYLQGSNLLPDDPKNRKEYPIITGVLDYFPQAIAEVAHVSFVGNQQHNPGQPLHWDRSKSTDQEDCIGRHTLQRGTFDTDGCRHSAKRAWRALAALQLEIEADRAKEQKHDP